MSAEERLKKLEQLYLHGVSKSEGQGFSIETLLDVLVILYDECTNSTLRREKNISDFVEFGKLRKQMFPMKLSLKLSLRHLLIIITNYFFNH